MNCPLMPKAVAGDMSINMGAEQYVADALDMGFRRRTQDRHHLYSSPIYTAMRHLVEPQPGMNDYRWMSREYARMREVAPLVIICLPSLNRVWENCRQDPHNAQIFDRKGKLASVYYQYL